jgi:hypothetical protein
MEVIEPLLVGNWQSNMSDLSSHCRSALMFLGPAAGLRSRVIFLVSCGKLRNLNLSLKFLDDNALANDSLMLRCLLEEKAGERAHCSFETQL